ncbi:MAG: LytR C-terminal domain-containing protein [Elusimicrobia bacterium]|nr:LytR C-terminal domain-containing protein [Elusimicrobiota bacterium]
MSSKRWRRVGWFGVLLLLLFFGSLVISLPWPRPGWRLQDRRRRAHWDIPAVWRFARGERVTGLLFVTDPVSSSPPLVGSGPGMIFLAVYTSQMRFLDLLSLPWETQVHLPGPDVVKPLGEFYAEEYQRSQGDLRAAAERLCRTIEGLVSSEQRDVRIDYFVQIRGEGFGALIGSLGGTQSVEFLHGPDSEWRGQVLVKQCLQRLQDPRWFLRLARSWPVVRRGGITNGTLWDLAHFVLEARGLNGSNIRFFQLPGRWMKGRWYPNPPLIPQTMEALFGMVPTPSAASTQPPAGQLPVHRQATTVEVWNASTQARLAYEVTLRLRSYGFDVVTFGNYSTRQHRTLVIDRIGNVWTAHTVARLLQATDADVVTRVDTARLVDISVILGEDYRTNGEADPPRP